MRKLLPYIFLFLWTACLVFQTSAEAQSSAGDEKSRANRQVAPPSGDELTDDAIRGVLQQLQKGMQNHDTRRLLAIFDAAQMDGYLQLQGQIEQLFDRYDAFQVHYRVVQTSMEGPQGIATIEMQMEADARRDGGSPLRRDAQLRFELLRGNKGWKIVAFQPRDFFTP
jgi:hypothetical protein